MKAIVLTPIILFLVCFCFGNFISEILRWRLSKTEKLMYGFLFMMGVFQLVATPFMYYALSFEPLYYIAIIVGLFLIVANITILIKKRRQFVSLNKKIFISQKGNIDKKDVIKWAIPILLILLQMFIVIYYEYVDIDDSYYIAEMSTILSTNKVLAVDPATGLSQFEFMLTYKLVGYEVWMTVISRALRINPAFLSHTVIPSFFIGMHYIIIYKIGERIKRGKGWIFLVFIILLNLVSGFSRYLPAFFVLNKIWQGKGLLANIVLPLLLYEFLVCFQKNKINAKNIVVFWMVFLAGHFTTTVGLYLVPIAYFAYAAAFALYNKKWCNIVRVCLPVLFILPNVLLKVKVLASSNIVELVTEKSGELSYFNEFFVKFFNSQIVILILFLMAILYFCISKSIYRYLFVINIIILLLTFANPLLINIVAARVTGASTYWRIFWLFQPTLLIAVALLQFISNKERYEFKIFIFSIVMIIVCGRFVYTAERLTPKSNWYKLDNESLKIANEILQRESGMTILFLPEELSYSIRQYTGDIQLVYSRYTNILHKDSNVDGYEQLVAFHNKLYRQQEWTLADIEQGKAEYGFDYLLLPKAALIDNEVPEDGINVYSDEKYCLYQF